MPTSPATRTPTCVGMSMERATITSDAVAAMPPAASVAHAPRRRVGAAAPVEACATIACHVSTMPRRKEQPSGERTHRRSSRRHMVECRSQPGDRCVVGTAGEQDGHVLDDWDHRQRTRVTITRFSALTTSPLEQRLGVGDEPSLVRASEQQQVARGFCVDVGIGRRGPRRPHAPSSTCAMPRSRTAPDPIEWPRRPNPIAVDAGSDSRWTMASSIASASALVPRRLCRAHRRSVRPVSGQVRGDDDEARVCERERPGVHQQRGAGEAVRDDHAGGTGARGR